MADERSDSDAVVNARDRIALIKGSSGAQHPDYASALNQLALLLIMQGDADSAEPLLREALDVRRATLGENHPDYATNLSSLGGVLWARGQLDQAEPLLQRAAEVRCATLGPSHPKSVVSLSSLDQLQKAKRDWQPSKPRVDPRPVILPSIEPKPTAAQVVVRSPDLPLSPISTFTSVPSEPVVVLAAVTKANKELGLTDLIARDLERLRDQFAALAELITRVARGLVKEGVDAPEALPELAFDARKQYESLIASVVEAHQVLELPLPIQGLDGLDRVTASLHALKEAEISRSTRKAIQAKAVEVLDRVGRIICPAFTEFEPLSRCRQAALGLKEGIQAKGIGEPSDDAGRLAEGEHAFCALLSLIGAGNDAADSDWAEWYESVESAFGNGLAVAAARSRLAESAGSK